MIGLNKKMISQNIKHLLKTKNMKFSSFEDEVGVSTGYVTSIGNEKRTSEPSLSIIYNIARALDVNIDLLINYDLSNVTNADFELLNFLQRLENYTITMDMIWMEMETDNFCKSCIESRDLHKLFSPNSLFTYRDRYVGLFENKTSIMLSPIVSEFKNSLFLFIPVKTRGKLSYELYVKEKNQLYPICHGIQGESILYDKMYDLFMIALEKYRSNKINDMKRELLDKF